MSHPIVALVGAVNVGKSSLFNRLLKKRQAITYDRPGVTRDCNLALWQGPTQTAWLVDTPGYRASLTQQDQDFDAEMQKSIDAHAETILDDCQLIVFVFDAQLGLSQQDRRHLKKLYKRQKPLIAVANKIDAAPIEHHDLVKTIDALSHHTVSAQAKQGFMQLGQALEAALVEHGHAEDDAISNPTYARAPDDAIHFALVGKPNVGKSTLTNALVRKEVSVISKTAGTTRDALFAAFSWRGHNFQLIDTAGIRRRAKIHDKVEQFAVSQVLQAIEKSSDVCVYLLDATEPLSDQDFRLINLINEARAKLMLVVNKSDLLSPEAKKKLEKEIALKLFSHTCYPILFISAKEKKALHTILHTLVSLHSQPPVPPTTELTKHLMAAVAQHQPPMIQNRRIKPRLASPYGDDPYAILIQGKQVSRLPQSYQQYLRKTFQEILGVSGILLKLVFRDDHNPYA